MSLSVIIPSRNESNLRACIKALRAAGETCRVIVVWDGPREDGIAAVEGLPGVGSLCHIARVIAGPAPFNFSRNCNLGILAAGEDDYLLLNDDAQLQTPRGFTLMHEAITARPHVGIVSAACTGIGNPNQNFDPRTAPGEMRGEYRVLAFVCVLIPRRTIDAVGLLDTRFPHSHNDNDLCKRVLDAGLKLGVFDGCRVDHETLPSTFRGPGGTPYGLDEGERLFVQKWGVASR